MKTTILLVIVCIIAFIAKTNAAEPFKYGNAAYTYGPLHWFTLGLITVLQPLNYLGFDIVLKRIIPKSLLSFQEYDEE